MEIKRYDSSLKEEWNKLIHDSRNGTFILYRDFMEYHADRFTDHSLLFYDGSRLIAVLPANIKDGTLYSHQGLTYGGIIQAEKTSIDQIRQIVEVLGQYLKENRIERLIYKPVPHIYHRSPAEEDIYALFQAGATLYRRSVASTINLENKADFDKSRKRALKRAIGYNYTVEEEKTFAGFWQILENNLSGRHGVSPVHSLNEIEYLHSKFPESIRIFSAFTPDRELAGSALIFETDTVAHLQYCSTDPDGRQHGALDIVFDYLINNTFRNKKYFDFGISTEDDGRILNGGLIFQKEGLGGRATVCDTYELIIK